MIGVFGSDTWEAFTEGRRRALLDLRFNLGPQKFRGFKKMIRAIHSGDWAGAAVELKNSLWWSQVQPERRELLYYQLRIGAICN